MVTNKKLLKFSLLQVMLLEQTSHRNLSPYLSYIPVQLV